MKTELIQKLVAALRRTNETCVEAHDTTLPGLHTEIREDDVKSWKFTYTPHSSDAKRSYHLGYYPEISLNVARKMATVIDQNPREGRRMIFSDMGIDSMVFDAILFSNSIKFRNSLLKRKSRFKYTEVLKALCRWDIHIQNLVVDHNRNPMGGQDER